MKKIILAAIVLIGAGVATTRAGVSFGISLNNGNGYYGDGYSSRSCGQASYGYAYGGQQSSGGAGYGYGYGGGYRYTQPSYGCAYGDQYYQYGQHQGLHQELRAEHRDLHG